MPENDMTENDDYDGVINVVETTSLLPSTEKKTHNVMPNFILMSVFFAANHGCVDACLSLAVARLGEVGAWQSGTLYLTYTSSAILGATYVVKRLGGRNALVTGMSLYCAYVGCFVVATAIPQIKTPVSLIGALIGGIGAGFIWTAQGSYFSKAAGEYSKETKLPMEDATSFFAGIFAFIYLSGEVSLKVLSTVMIEFWSFSWEGVFTAYFLISLTAAIGMLSVYDYHTDREDKHSTVHKFTAAWTLLVKDEKMKYMIGLNAAFGFCSSFINSYVSGEVVGVSLADNNSTYVGLLSAITPAVAAIMSISFGYLSLLTGKEPVLMSGNICFFLVALSFVLKSSAESWGWSGLIIVFSLHGIGRATFESTLRATFADFFPNEKEGAFANIVLQNGFCSSVGYFLAYSISWRAYEVLVMISAVLAILGYKRALSIRENELYGY